MKCPCTITCSIALVFIVSKIYMLSSMRSSQAVQKYQAQLPSQLRRVYQEIVTERTQIYYTGYALGVLLACIIIFYNTSLRKERASALSMVSTVVASAFIMNYFYYVLSPKTQWMLDHITTSEQNRAWLEMYRNMQVFYHSGLVLGLIALGLFAFAFC
jgi:uncharacterized membrane protein YkgB